MVSTVLRQNHYELLGLTPAATAEEIVQAFAKELGLLRPRAFGSLAEVTVAYETLKDPIKRDAYDASIGLRAEPSRPSPEAPPEWEPFLVRASAQPVEKPAIPFPPPSPLRPTARPEMRFEPRMAPSATALLREPIRPLARPEIPSEAPGQRQPEVMEEPSFETTEPEPGHIEHRVEIESLLDHRNREFAYGARPSIAWKLPAFAAGALVLAIGVGAWAGWGAGNDADMDRLTPAATIKIPQPSTVADATDPAILQAPPAAQPAPKERTRTRAAPAAKAPARPPLEISLPEKQEAEVTLLEQRQNDLETERSATESSSVAPTSAKLPLPDAVVARTIARIGFPCGQVASTTALEQGAFKVTCTSGHSYRAAPVRGRYYFRKL